MGKQKKRRAVYALRSKNIMKILDDGCTFTHICRRNVQHKCFFVDLLYVGTSCIAKYTTDWRCYLFLYSVKDPPVISRKILQKWLLWAKPESSAILSIV